MRSLHIPVMCRTENTTKNNYKLFSVISYRPLRNDQIRSLSKNKNIIIDYLLFSLMYQLALRAIIIFSNANQSFMNHAPASAPSKRKQFLKKISMEEFYFEIMINSKNLSPAPSSSRLTTRELSLSVVKRRRLFRQKERMSTNQTQSFSHSGRFHFP